jgi:hypothetical protein
LDDFKAILEQARLAREMAEALNSDEQAPAVKALAKATICLADEFESLIDAIIDLGGRLDQEGPV